MEIATILSNNSLTTARQYYVLIVENLLIDAFTIAQAQFDLMEPTDQNKFLHYVWDSWDFWGLSREQTNTIIHWLN